MEGNYIADAFYTAYMSDTEAPDKIDATLEQLHNEIPEQLDRVLIAICGYSYKSLDEMRNAADFNNTTKIG